MVPRNSWSKTVQMHAVAQGGAHRLRGRAFQRWSVGCGVQSADFGYEMSDQTTAELRGFYYSSTTAVHQRKQADDSYNYPLALARVPGDICAATAMYSIPDGAR